MVPEGTRETDKLYPCSRPDMSCSSDDPRQLLNRIAQHDGEALAAYLQLRRQDLLHVILSRMGPALRSRVEAEDIFQDICQSALRSLDEVQFSEGGVWGWLCELATRRIVDAQRRFSAGKRSAHGEVAIEGKPEQSHAGLVNLLVASITSPSQAFSRQQREFRLIAALDELGPDQQRALQLRYGQGKSSKEVAAALGKSDGATRVLLTRALHRLRSLLESPEA